MRFAVAESRGLVGSHAVAACDQMEWDVVPSTASMASTSDLQT
jgi:hypothetical protein